MLIFFSAWEHHATEQRLDFKLYYYQFLEWVDAAKLQQKTKTYYKDGWRLLSATPLTGMRLDLITNDEVETLSFPGSAANTNCALRTLRRMLHRAVDWKLIRRAPKLKLEKEYGRSLTLDEEIEKKLIAGAAACNWKKDILRAVPGCRDPDARHRNAERARTVPHPTGASGLEGPDDFCTGQQD